MDQIQEAWRFIERNAQGLTAWAAITAIAVSLITLIFTIRLGNRQIQLQRRAVDSQLDSISNQNRSVDAQVDALGYQVAALRIERVRLVESMAPRLEWTTPEDKPEPYRREVARQSILGPSYRLANSRPTALRTGIGVTNIGSSTVEIAVVDQPEIGTMRQLRQELAPGESTELALSIPALDARRNAPVLISGTLRASARYADVSDSFRWWLSIAPPTPRPDPNDPALWHTLFPGFEEHAGSCAQPYVSYGWVSRISRVAKELQ